MRNQVCFAALLTLSLSATACETKDEPKTEADFCAEYAKRECATIGTYCAFATPDACQATRTSECLKRGNTWKSASRPYTPSNTAGCLDKLGKVYSTFPISAQNLTELDQICSRVYQGTNARNDACLVDIDCVAGLICDKGRCGPETVVGASAGCANVGELCPTGQICKLANSLYTCQPRQVMGATCGVNDPCVETLRCTGTCVARSPLSSACTSNDECALPYGFCDPYAHVCTNGLTFAVNSDSCKAFAGSGGGDAGTD